MIKLIVNQQGVGGSIGAFYDKIIVQFRKREYVALGESLNVLTLDKIGDWD